MAHTAAPLANPWQSLLPAGRYRGVSPTSPRSSRDTYSSSRARILYTHTCVHPPAGLIYHCSLFSQAVDARPPAAISGPTFRYILPEVPTSLHTRGRQRHSSISSSRTGLFLPPLPSESTCISSTLAPLTPSPTTHPTPRPGVRITSEPTCELRPPTFARTSARSKPTGSQPHAPDPTRPAAPVHHSRTTRG